MYYSTAKKCLLVSTFLEGLIFGGCNPGPKALSAYGWILQESGPYPVLSCASLNAEPPELFSRLTKHHFNTYNKGYEYQFAADDQQSIRPKLDKQEV